MKTFEVDYSVQDAMTVQAETDDEAEDKVVELVTEQYQVPASSIVIDYVEDITELNGK